MIHERMKETGGIHSRRRELLQDVWAFPLVFFSLSFLYFEIFVISNCFKFKTRFILFIEPSLHYSATGSGGGRAASCGGGGVVVAAGAAEVLDLVPPRDGVPAPDLVAPILDVVDVVVVFVIGLPGVAVLLATPAEKIRKCNFRERERDKGDVKSQSKRPFFSHALNNNNNALLFNGAGRVGAAVVAGLAAVGLVLAAVGLVLAAVGLGAAVFVAVPLTMGLAGVRVVEVVVAFGLMSPLVVAAAY